MSHSNPSEVSVLICCKNSEDYIDSCLQAILIQFPLEIVVIDGDSSDQTVLIAKKYTSHVYSDEKRGLGHARKLGVSKCSGQFIVIVSPDDAISSDFLSSALAEIKMEDKIAALLAPKRMAKVLSFWDHGQEAIYSLIQTLPLRVVGNPSIYRTKYLKSFPYDESFSACEDTDLCERWNRAGLVVGWGKKFHTFEIENRDFNAFRDRYIWYGKGDYRFCKKWFEIDKKVALRHFFHPLKNYIVKYTILLFLRGDIRAAVFSVLCGLFRYQGYVREFRALKSAERGQ